MQNYTRICGQAGIPFWPSGFFIHQHALACELILSESGWDAHDTIDSNHRQHGKEVDKPITGLITDLKRRGLLDETVVAFHSEFGRMPISPRGLGRDHNPGGHDDLYGRAGIQGGRSIGTSDDVGLNAEEQPVSNHDVHASLLHLMGMDHKKLTYYFNGRNMSETVSIAVSATIISITYGVLNSTGVLLTLVFF